MKKLAFSKAASPPAGATVALVDDSDVVRWQGVVELTDDGTAYVEIPELPKTCWVFVQLEPLA